MENSVAGILFIHKYIAKSLWNIDKHTLRGGRNNSVNSSY